MAFPIRLIRLSSFSIHPIYLSQALLLQVPCDVGAEPWRFCSFTQKEAQQKKRVKESQQGRGVQPEAHTTVTPQLFQAPQTRPHWRP